MTKRLLKFGITSYPTYILATLVLALFHALLEGAGFGLLLPIIEGLQSPEAITPNHPISVALENLLLRFGLPFSFTVLVISGISLFFIQAILEYWRTVISARIVELVDVDIRTNLFSSLLSASLPYFHQKKLGDLVNAVVLEAHRASFAFSHLIKTIVSASLVCVYFIVAFLVSWRLSLIAGLLALPLLYLTRQRKQIIQKGEEVSLANESFQSTSVEYLMGVREIKIYGLIEKISEAFQSVAINLGVKERQLTVLSARLVFVYNIIAVFFLIIFASMGSYVFKTSPAELATFLAILLRLSPAVTLLQQNRDKYLGVLPGFGVVERMQNEIRDSMLGKMENQNAIIPEKLKSSVELRDVDFAYRDHHTVINQLTLTIGRGQILAVVGSSGAGKSTLVDLIVRFFDPDSGQVLIDGVDLKEIDVAAWRRMIGYVSQEAFLFNDTVFQNIQYGDTKANIDDVVLAAKQANAHEFILELPNQYDTKIGDRGVMLSGGQRQRLALARAILRNPDILILDEATSDLDTKSERLIQKSLHEISQDRTVIIIAHRLSTVESADEIIVVEGGIIVEHGNHQELLEKRGKYAEFYNLQISKADHDLSDL